MNKHQKILIDMLSAAIRNRIPSFGSMPGIDWPFLFKETKAHQVYTILYPLVKKLGEAGLGPDDELLATWRNISFAAGMMQLQHLDSISRVLDLMQNEGIKVVVLKGLVIREFYPEPELRTMSDADILVRGDQYDRARDLLIRLGYKETGSDSKHSHFQNNVDFPIELHHKLGKEHFTGAENWESRLWERVVPVTINGVSAWSLSDEDQLVHICLHMAGHLLSYGFGVRQLCDLVLFYENRGNKMNWDLFCSMSSELGILNFAKSIFTICNFWFNMDIPEVLKLRFAKNEHQIELLKDDILAGGVHGKRTLDRKFNYQLMSEMDQNKSDYIPGRFARFTSYVFPPGYKLVNKYNFVHKYPFLLPAAWIHRIIYGIVRKDFSLSEKTSSITTIATEERYSMLHWLGLL